MWQIKRLPSETNFLLLGRHRLTDPAVLRDCPANFLIPSDWLPDWLTDLLLPLPCV